MVNQIQKVVSGRTKFALTQMQKWQQNELFYSDYRLDENGKMIQNEFGDYEWGFNVDILKRIIQERKLVPFYNFMLMYILIVHDQELDEEIKKAGGVENFYRQLVSELHANKQTYKKTTKNVRKIVDLVFDDFVSNGYGNQATETTIGSYKTTTTWTKQDLFKVITADQCSFDNLIVLALGLNMDYQDVDIFLTKALRRTTFNLWSAEEFILFLAFKYALGDRLAFYNAALAIFKDKHYLPIEVNWMEEVGVNTTVVRNKIDYILNLIQEREYVIGLDENNQLSTSVINLICIYKYLISTKTNYVRTIKKEAKDMLEEFEGNYKELEEMYTVDLGDRDENHACGNVQIYFDAIKGVNIPAGTKFYKTKKGVRLATFVATKDTVIEPTNDDYVDIEIPVVCTMKTKKTKEKEGLIGYVPKQSSFHILDATLVGIVKELRNKSAFKAPTNAKVGEDTYVSGKIQAKCRPNCSIPKGTKFGFNGLEYVSTKEVVVERYVEIFVQCTSIKEEATKNTINDCSIDSWHSQFYKIGNTKIGFIQKEEKAKGGILDNYLYKKSNDLALQSVLTQEEVQQLDLVLDHTRFSPTKIHNIKNLVEENITRNDILTLSFLEFVSTTALDGVTPYEVRAAFKQFANDKLRKCGFYEIYQPNPYDAILTAISTSSEALDGFRNLWEIYLSSKKGNE